MTTFNELTPGFNSGIKFYNATILEAKEAIKNADFSAKYYIAFSLNADREAKRVQIYVNPNALPNGWASKGKIYEGSSKRKAIEALQINE